MKLKRIGLDLAKNVFQIHGVDSHEQVKMKKQVKRQQMLHVFRQIEPCVVAMEALWQRALLGTGTGKAGPHSKIDRTVTCEAVCEKRQERRQ